MLYTDFAWAGGDGFETKSLREADDVLTFTGIASTTDTDLAREVIEPGAFGAIEPKHIPLLRDHHRELVIGGWRKFAQDGKNLAVEGCVSLRTEKGRETAELMKQGFLTGISVGYIVNPGGATHDTRAGVRRIKSAILVEGSIVGCPANRRTRILSVKSLLTSSDDTRQWLSDNGLEEKDIDVVMKKGFDALLDERPRRPLITEIDGHHADESGMALFAELAAQVKHLCRDVTTSERVSK